MAPESYRPWPHPWLAHEHVVSAVWIPELEICRTGRGSSKKGVTYSSHSNHAWSPLACGWHLPILNWEGYPLTEKRKERKKSHIPRGLRSLDLMSFLMTGMVSGLFFSRIPLSPWISARPFKKNILLHQLLKAECWVRLTELILLCLFPSLCVFHVLCSF